jgi:Sec-independent protein translocase protein TatA
MLLSVPWGLAGSVGLEKRSCRAMIAELLGPDIVIVVVVLFVLAFLGPRLARNLGAAKKEFEKSVKSDDTPSTPEEKK